MVDYIPKRGDIVWIEFNPQKGHKQRGHRPALVLSPYAYNEKTSLAILVPITSKSKAYPFEVPLINQKSDGVVLSDHVKSLDFRSRNVKFIEEADENVVLEVLEKLKLLLD